MADGEGGKGALLPIVPALQRRWASSVFGIVAPGAVRRRPSDVARILITVTVLATTAAGASTVTSIEQAVLDLVAALPGGLEPVFEVCYRSGTLVAGVLAASAVASRRGRLVGTLGLAGAVGWALALLLRALVDVPDLLAGGQGRLAGVTPDYPVVPLAASVAVLLAARPFLTRPARHLVAATFWLSALGAVYLAAGLPVSVLASLVLGWGSAAVAHLVLGSPGGVPSVAQVRASLEELGVAAGALELDADQSWGRTSFTDAAGDGLAVEVVGRDATDARLFAKLWRSLWYKDAGRTIALRRDQQVEHEALVMLLAGRRGARVPELVAVGVAGARDDALLVVRDPPGPALVEVEPSDAVLRDAWENLGRLHATGIAHGDITAHRLVVGPGDAVGLRRLSQAELAATPDRLAVDRAQLLVATADRAGVERALAAARSALGDDDFGELLAYLQPAALSGRARSELTDVEELLDDLREQGGALVAVDAPETVALRRFSLGGILLAGAFGLGVYLLVVQLAGVAEMGDVFTGAAWGWVALTALIAQAPPYSQGVAMLGSVSPSLPLRPVAVVQYAQAFTGLVGGTAGNATLTIRFFQKQGLKPAVAVSSGVLNSLAGFAVQITLVVIGLLVTGSSFDLDTGGTSVPGWLGALVVAVAVGAVAVLAVPRLRARMRDVVTSQLREAWANVRGVLATPRRAVQLFGGNLVSQVLFAMVLGAALHAYGESLPLLQIIVINSFASFVGGAVPVPGGMGVVEGGMIAGFTAAGVPQAEAVAATFTARMFTTYLTPIWGWVAFRWLTRHDYV